MATLWMALAAGCGGRAARPEAQSPVLPRPGPPVPTVLPRTVVTPHGAADIEELHARAARLLAAGDAAAAARAFDEVVRLDPDGPLAPQALHDAGQAHEAAGDRAAAVARFEQVARRFPDHALGRDALLRAVRLSCFLERWQRCGEAAELLLSRHRDLVAIERVVALSGKALALIAAGDIDGATHFIEKGRTVVDEHRLDAAGAIPRDIAQLYYALGEVRRIRAEKIRFVPVPANFAAVLEERCQLLLDAQSAYSDTMRAYDAHWSAMAGFRVGELYHKLHEDLMVVPSPKADTEAKRQLFEGAMRLRYSILLDKALAMMQHTLSMASRVGERSQWVDRAQDSKQKLERARDQEQKAIDRLPYTRADLQAALDDLARTAEERDKQEKKDKAKGRR